MTTVCQILALFMLPCPTPDTGLTLAETRVILYAAGYEGELLDDAVAIVACEQGRWYEYSNGVPESEIWFPWLSIGDGGEAVGLFQIHSLWVWWWYDESGQQLSRHDPYENALLARRINEYDMARYGTPWQQWSCDWAAEFQ